MLLHHDQSLLEETWPFFVLVHVVLKDKRMINVCEYHMSWILLPWYQVFNTESPCPSGSLNCVTAESYPRSESRVCHWVAILKQPIEKGRSWNASCYTYASGVLVLTKSTGIGRLRALDEASNVVTDTLYRKPNCWWRLLRWFLKRDWKNIVEKEKEEQGWLTLYVNRIKWRQNYDMETHHFPSPAKRSTTTTTETSDCGWWIPA